jgi:autocrine motility factor receptor
LFLFQVVLLSIRTLHVIIRYALHLYDMRQEGASSVSTNEENKVWEKRGPIAYYTELGFELTALIIDFVHHLHMLVWSNIFLSMASLVICMQLRYLFHEIQRRYKKHRNYLWVRNHLEQKYVDFVSTGRKERNDEFRFVAVIRWLRQRSSLRIPIIVRSVGRRWSRPGSCLAHICSTSKCKRTSFRWL